MTTAENCRLRQTGSRLTNHLRASSVQGEVWSRKGRDSQEPKELPNHFSRSEKGRRSCMPQRLFKKKPSCRILRPTDGTGWHYSYLKSKKVYGYQIYAALHFHGQLVHKCWCLGQMRGEKVPFNRHNEGKPHSLPQRSSYFCQLFRIQAHEGPASLCNGERSKILCASPSETS